MNEFESKLLAQEAEQNATLIRLERALVEVSKTQQAILLELLGQAKRPNVVHLRNQLRSVEGEVSELRGVVARHDAAIEQLAAGGRDGR